MLDKTVRSDTTHEASELTRLLRDHGWDPSSVAVLRDGVWQTKSTAPTSAFKYDELDHEQISKGSWWFQIRNDLILATLSSSLARHHSQSGLWDVGAGVGTVSAFLDTHLCEVVAVEPDAAGASSVAAAGITSIAGELRDLELPSGSLQNIALFDVLEHLDDPNQLLEECKRILNPGGRIFITVPALPVLWSNADDDAEHKMRYTKKTLLKLCESAGLRTMKLEYWFKSLVIPMLCLRALPTYLGQECSSERHKRQLGASSRLLTQSVRTTEAVLKIFPLPGSTLYGEFSRG